MSKEKRSIHFYMRSLHRDVGYFVVGLTILYALSGITLIYRDTDFLKKEKIIEKQLSPKLDESKLGRELHMRRLKVMKTEGDVVFFENGTYNSATGIANYTVSSLPIFLEKMNSFHKQSSQDATHLLSIVFGILLLFLAISSFWMFKPNTKKFKRGLLYAGFGIVVAVVILFL